MNGTTQMAILNRMAKLEAKFEKFMRQFETSAGAASSEFITGTPEPRKFKPIDSIERLDEFESKLNDPEYENEIVSSVLWQHQSAPGSQTINHRSLFLCFSSRV